MKVYEIQGSGIDSLTLAECPDPQPGYGQVLIKVRATSLNYRDLIVVGGNYSGQKSSLIPMSDGAGDVVAVGEGVTRIKVGDRVAGIFFQDWLSGTITKEIMKSDLGGGIDGMLAEYVTLDQNGVVLLPSHLSYEEGATLPCAAVTAWHALVTKGNVRAGETVLQGIYVGSREMFEAMNRAIAHHQLEPAIDRVFEFAEAKEAYQYMKCEQLN